MAKNDPDLSALTVEIEGIKKLFILGLLRSGASQGEIASALGVSQPSISRMFPGGIGKTTKKTKTSKR